MCATKKMRRTKSAPAACPCWQKKGISDMNRNTMGKILKGNIKSAIELKKALGTNPNWMENVGKKYVANTVSRKLRRRRNITNLVTLYRTGTHGNRNAHRRMMTRMRNLGNRIPILNEAIVDYYRTTLPKRPLTNRNVGIVFAKATDAALRAFIRSRRRQNTTLGGKLFVV